MGSIDRFVHICQKGRRDTTEGFFSRWVVVPFTAFFPAGVADTTLIDRLTRQANLQGLLRMAVGGLQAVLRRGSFALPESVRAATERFRMEADPLRAFIEERLTAVPEHGPVLPRTEVYTVYTVWAMQQGYHAMSAARFYESFLMALTGMGWSIRPVTINGIRGYKGIMLQ